MRTGAFRRVHSSCNTFANGNAAGQAHSIGRPASRGVVSMDIPMTYPNSPAALQQVALSTSSYIWGQFSEVGYVFNLDTSFFCRMILWTSL